MGNKPLTVLITEFLEEQDVSDLSRKSYRIVILQFVRWVVINKVEFWKIRRADIIRYKSDLVKTGKASNTLDLYLTVVRKFFQWLEYRGLYENIAAGVHSPRKYRGFKKEYLQRDQVKQLLSVIDTGKVVGKRDFAIISLMVRAGLRAVEVCRMAVGDIVRGAQYTVRLQRKGHTEKDCEVGVTDKIIEAIHDYLLSREDIMTEGSPLFVSHSRMNPGCRLTPRRINRIVKKYLCMIGIEDRRITGHSLRHTAAILSLKAGATIDEVQQMLGHASIETTKIYLSAIEEETRLNNRAARILDKLF